MLSAPKLVAHAHDAETKLQKVLRWIGTIFKVGSMFVGQTLSLALILGMGWLLSQTFLFEFVLPALKQMFFNAAGMLLPTAMVPWAPTILLGSIGVILGGQILYAVLTDTFFESPNANYPPFGTGAYVVLGWLVPAYLFVNSYSHGVALSSSLFTAAMWGGVLGTAISPLVPILDSPYKSAEKLGKAKQWVTETLIPNMQWSWMKAKELYQREVVPRFNRNFSWVTDIFKRLMPKETPAAVVPVAAPAVAGVPIAAAAGSAIPLSVDAALPAPDAAPAVVRSYEAARAAPGAVSHDEPFLLPADPLEQPEASRRPAP